MATDKHKEDHKTDHKSDHKEAVKRFAIGDEVEYDGERAVIARGPSLFEHPIPLGQEPKFDDTESYDVTSIDETGGLKIVRRIPLDGIKPLSDEVRDEFLERTSPAAAPVSEVKQLGPRQKGTNFPKQKGGKAIEAGSKDAEAAGIPDSAFGGSSVAHTSVDAGKTPISHTNPPVK